MKKVYGDYFAEYLEGAINEMKEKEDEFILDDSGKLLQFEKDPFIYEGLRSELEVLRGFLVTDEVRGSTAMSLFRERVVEGEYQDLFYRLVESEKYPKVWELYEYEQEVK